MGKVDEKRELIGILKVYMSLTVAVIVAGGGDKQTLFERPDQRFVLGGVDICVDFVDRIFIYIVYKAQRDWNIKRFKGLMMDMAASALYLTAFVFLSSFVFGAYKFLSIDT